VRCTRNLVCAMEGERCGYMEKLLLYCITAYYVFHVQPENDHCQAPKHVVVPYVVDYLQASTIK